MDQSLRLDTRQGLPDHLRILADRYPREMWQGHANFNEMTAFWLERHLMFRQILDKLTADTEGFLDGTAGPRYGAELSRYAGFFLNQLHGHHTIEDQHYFPQFNALDKRMDQAFALLDADHHALDAHIHDFGARTNAVLGALQQDGDARAFAGQLHDAQRAFHGFLDRHLMDEEEIIVPIVLEYGPEMQ